MGSKCAILGASGRLGSSTLKRSVECCNDPGNFVALVRQPSKVEEWARNGVLVRRADYDDRASLVKALEGVDRLLLVPSTGAPSHRVRQYENAIAAAREAGVEHLIHFGLVPATVEAAFVATPFLLYAESAVRTSGLAWTILRNGLYSDPIADWVPTILELGFIPYPTGDGRCAYVTRDDIARAAAAVLCGGGHEGKVYKLTGPASLGTADLAAIVNRVTGREVSGRNATDQDYIDICREQGEPEGMIQTLLSLCHTVRDGHLDVASSDIELLTGEPAEPFEDYLRRRLS